MLDVIHYFLEEDLVRFESGEQAEAASKTRESIYGIIYDRTYKYSTSNSSSFRSKTSHSGMTYADGSPVGLMEDDLSDVTPFDPNAKKSVSKPYIPATTFNPESSMPFGKDIDAPLG